MMTRRRLIYWGLPIIGALVGTGVTIWMKSRHEDSRDIFDNQVDAFVGAVIWFGIVTIGKVILRAFL